MKDESVAPQKWLLVAGGFHDLGGQDRANAEIARYLHKRGDEITIVSHTIAPEFFGRPNIQCVVTPTVRFSAIGSDLFLAPASLYRVISSSGRGVRVIANGGNFATSDVNWVHFVHRAWKGDSSAVPLLKRISKRLLDAHSRWREKRAIKKAKLLIANSELTKRHLVQLYGVPADRVKVVWLGSGEEFGCISESDRRTARKELGLRDETPVALFVGALGADDRKGLGPLLGAWRKFRKATNDDSVLLVVGQGSGYRQWSELVSDPELGQSVRMLGFRTDVAELLGAADVFVSPARYESYGLNVHEALARGVPAIASRHAGVADRYPESLRPLLLDDPACEAQLVERLLLWRSDREKWQKIAVNYGAEIRSWKWEDMAEQFVRLALESGGPR